MSSRPCAFIVSAIRARHDSSSRTSTGMALALPPADVELAHRGGVLRCIASGDDDRGAGCCHALGHAEADAAIAAGDDGDPAGKIEKLHVRSPGFPACIAEGQGTSRRMARCVRSKIGRKHGKAGRGLALAWRCAPATARPSNTAHACAAHAAEAPSPCRRLERLARPAHRRSHRRPATATACRAAAPCSIAASETSSLHAGRADWQAANREWRQPQGCRHSDELAPSEIALTSCREALVLVPGVAFDQIDQDRPAGARPRSRRTSHAAACAATCRMAVPPALSCSCSRAEAAARSF